MEMWQIKYSWHLAIPRHEPQQITRCVLHTPPPFHFEIQILGSKIKWWGPLINNFANIINSCRITEYSIASGSNQVKKMIYIHLSNITAVTLLDEEWSTDFLKYDLVHRDGNNLDVHVHLSTTQGWWIRCDDLYMDFIDWPRYKV